MTDRTASRHLQTSYREPTSSTTLKLRELSCRIAGRIGSTTCRNSGVHRINRCNSDCRELRGPTVDDHLRSDQSQREYGPVTVERTKADHCGAAVCNVLGSGRVGHRGTGGQIGAAARSTLGLTCCIVSSGGRGRGSGGMQEPEVPEVSPGWMADGCGDILKSVSSFPINGLRTSAGTS